MWASVALVPDTERGSAIQMHRQAVRLIHGLGDRIGLEPKADWTPLPEELWRAAYDLVEPTELPLRPFDESYALMCEMRDRFHPMMEAFMDELLAPRGFWGPTTADDMVAAPFDELREELFGDPDLDI